MCVRVFPMVMAALGLVHFCFPLSPPWHFNIIVKTENSFIYRCYWGKRFLPFFSLHKSATPKLRTETPFLESATESKVLKKKWCCLFHLRSCKCFPKSDSLILPCSCEAGSILWAPTLGIKTKLNQSKINVTGWIWDRNEQNWYTRQFPIKLLPVSQRSCEDSRRQQGHAPSRRAGQAGMLHRDRDN